MTIWRFFDKNYIFDFIKDNNARTAKTANPATKRMFTKVKPRDKTPSKEKMIKDVDKN